MSTSNFVNDVKTKHHQRQLLEKKLEEYFAKGGKKYIAPYGAVAEDIQSKKMKLEEISDGGNNYPKAPSNL